jgi:hypothetical protein
MSTPTLCPSCAGPSQPDHPGGVLAGWRHDPTSCELLAREDATAMADADRLEGRTRFNRIATATEMELLAASGFAWTVDPLLTVVRGVTPGLRRRLWPDAQPPTEEA